MYLIKSVIFLSILFLISGCTSKMNKNNTYSFPNFKYNYELEETNYDEIILNLLDKASNQIFPNMKRGEILLVSNFAETVTLRSKTKLSFLLTDLLKEKLISKYSYTIREIELSNKFRLGSDGFKVLTRDVNSINSSINKARYAVVGVYTLTKNQLLLFLKVIDIRDGRIVAASSYKTNLTQEIVDANKIIIKDNITIYQPMVL